MSKIVIGPIPCRECGRFLVWDGIAYTFRGTNILHVPATCPATWEKRMTKGARR